MALANDVWSSADGVNWTCATAEAEWSKRGCHTAVVFGGKIWLYGGNDDDSRMLHDIWSSSDGIHWTLAAANAPWPVRVWHTIIVYAGKLWMLGGYTPTGMKNDVWNSSDGVHWTLVKEHAPWKARGGHAAVVHNGRLWIMGGLPEGGYDVNIADVWSTTDGVTWECATRTGGVAISGAQAMSYDGRIWLLGGDWGGPAPKASNEIWSSADGRSWKKDGPHVPLWSGRTGAASAVFQDKIWIMGGGWKVPTITNDVWYYTRYNGVASAGLYE